MKKKNKKKEGEKGARVGGGGERGAQVERLQKRYFEGAGIDVEFQFPEDKMECQSSLSALLHSDMATPSSGTHASGAATETRQQQPTVRMDKLLTVLFPGLTRQYLLFLIENGHVRLVYRGSSHRSSPRGGGSEDAVVERRKGLKIDPSKLASVLLHLQPRHATVVDAASNSVDGISEYNVAQLENEVREVEQHSVVYEDEHVLVWNKESGKAVHPSQGHPYKTTVLCQVQQYCAKRRNLEELQDEHRNTSRFPLRVAFAHRLDRDTSGALVAGKSSHAVQFLSGQFSNKADSTKKQYLAVCTFAKGVLPDTLKYEKGEERPSFEDGMWANAYTDDDFALAEDLHEWDGEEEEVGMEREWERDGDDVTFASTSHMMNRAEGRDSNDPYANYKLPFSQRMRVRAETDGGRRVGSRKRVSHFASDAAYPLLQNEREQEHYFSFVEDSYQNFTQPFREYIVIDQPIVPIANTGIMYSMGTKDEIDAELSRRSEDKEKRSRSVVHILDINERKKIALVLVNIDTGRTHQIRTHLSSISLPVLGDLKYGLFESRIPIMAAHRLGVTRVMLHCRKLSFQDPVEDQRKIHVVAPMSDDMRQLIMSSFNPLKVQRLLRDEAQYSAKEKA